MSVACGHPNPNHDRAPFNEGPVYVPRHMRPPEPMEPLPGMVAIMADYEKRKVMAMKLSAMVTE